MTPAQINGVRRRLTNAFRKRIAPHLRESGYLTPIDPKRGIIGGTRPLLAWSPGRGVPIEVGGFVADTIYAVTEDGVMTDAYGGGAVTTGWAGLPIDDLARLLRWAERTFPSTTVEGRNG